MSADRSLERLARRDWLSDSPLASFVSPYIEFLRNRRYADRTIHSYLGCLAHFSYWIKTAGVELLAVDVSLVN